MSASPLFTAGDDIRDLNDFDLSARPPGEALDALAGNDVVTLSETQNLGLAFVAGSGDDTVWGSSGDDIIRGSYDDDLLKGRGGADSLFGGGEIDRLEGGDGDDRLYGGNGNDLLLGGNDNDWLKGDNDDDRLYGGNGDDRLYGGNGDDRLYGGDGNDRIDGRQGDDVIRGGLGNDVLRGDEAAPPPDDADPLDGLGADLFVWTERPVLDAPDSEAVGVETDVILDFSARPDFLGDLPLGFDYIDLRALDVTADDVSVRRVDAGRLDVYVDTNDDAKNAGDLRIVVYTDLADLDVGAPAVANEIWVDVV
jgi:Ca2+-binding RTX toxin-like protein